MGNWGSHRHRKGDAKSGKPDASMSSEGQENWHARLLPQLGMLLMTLIFDPCTHYAYRMGMTVTTDQNFTGTQSTKPRMTS
jgi:hypothetical protein